MKREFSGRIPKCFPYFVDGLAETFVKIHEDAGRPDPVAQFFPRDHLAGTLQEHHENLERLVLQLDLRPLPAHLPGPQIDFENSEPNNVVGVFGLHRRLWSM